MNLFDNINKNDKNEITDILFKKKNIRVERIISSGQVSPEDFWYDQHEDEWLCVLQGTGIIEYQDKTSITLIKGDTLLIPAHKKHRVTYTSNTPECIWLCIFYSE